MTVMKITTCDLEFINIGEMLKAKCDDNFCDGMIEVKNSDKSVTFYNKYFPCIQVIFSKKSVMEIQGN